MEHNFGRIESPLDTRDFKLGNYIPAKYDTTGSKDWPFLAEPLDQKLTNHCVGFAMANWGINLPIQDNFTNETGHELYRKCKVIDGDPFGEDGTYIRTAAKVLREIGLIDTYAFAYSVDEIAFWLLNRGPVIVGTKWTAGMNTSNEYNVIRPTGEVLGGHGYLLNEKTKDGLFGIQNSWNGFWGIKGKSYISMDDFAILFRSGGEAIAAVEVAGQTIPGKGDGCLAAMLKILNRK
jgi:hypothetical protein